MKIWARSRASSRCCDWSWPTGTCEVLQREARGVSVARQSPALGCEGEEGALVEKDVGGLEDRVGEEAELQHRVVDLVLRVGVADRCELGLRAGTKTRIS